MANIDLINKIEELLNPNRKADEMQRIREAVRLLAEEIVKKKDKQR